MIFRGNENGIIQSGKLGYRADIDGLRAVAVLPVVLFHAGISPFSGGYVGVDVFFVISGFLITSILRDQIASKQFSLLWFYERRARRILPALFAVAAATFVGGWFVSIPDEYVSLSQSALSTIFFSSNIFFYISLDYFSSAAEFHPLLHTWSLAVEEQFYIFFPLFLMIIPANWLGFSVTIVFVSSLSLSVYFVEIDPAAAFYLLPMRAWELMLGAMVALQVLPTLRARSARQIGAVVGIAVIIAPTILYGAETPFPGLAALPPCIGATLLVSMGADTAVGRALASKPVVFVGLISYSLYLWHWPILALLRLSGGAVELSAVQAWAAIALSFVFAILSWRYIERPFRHDRRFDRGRIFQLSAAGLLALSVLAVGTIANDGFPQRFDQRVATVLAGENDTLRMRQDCRDGTCLFGNAGSSPAILLWGDSHVRALVPALDHAARAAGTGGTARWKSACAPLLGIRRTDHARAGACQRFNDETIEFIRRNAGQIKMVVLAGRWALYATGTRPDGEEGKDISLAPISPSPGMADQPSSALFEYGLRRTFAELTKAKVKIVVLGGVPEIGWHVPRELASAIASNRAPPAPPSLAAVRMRNKIADEIISEVVSEYGARVVDIVPALCPDKCQVIDGDFPLYSDDDHLSVYGSTNFVGKYLEAIGILAP